MVKRPIIIDTDLTRDDVLAIAMAAKHFDIKAITCFGDCLIDTVMVRDKLELNCPVAWGATKPLFKPMPETEIYVNWIGDEDALPYLDEKDDCYAWDIIYSEAVKAKGHMEIVTLGPVTNIATALLRYPQLKSFIKRIFCFAGTGYVGNILPYSEYNAYVDPDALKILFESGIDVVMCGLDGIESCVADYEELKGINVDNVLVRDVLDTLYNNKKEFKAPAAAAMSCYISEDVTPVKEFYVKVETKGEQCKGQTIVDRLGKYKKQPNIKTVVESSKQEFIKNISILAE